MEFFDGQVDHIRRRFPANTGFYAFMVGTIIDLSQGHSMLFQFGTHLFVYFEHIFPGIYPFSDSSLIGDDDQKDNRLSEDVSSLDDSGLNTKSSDCIYNNILLSELIVPSRIQKYWLYSKIGFDIEVVVLFIWFNTFLG